MSLSIDGNEFKRMLEFVSEFAKKMTIGPNDTQIGVITYGNVAHVEFNLAAHKTSGALENAIKNITLNNEGQGTNTPDGLCKLMKEFKNGEGLRSSSATVYRFAIVLSDGLSNWWSKECDDWNTLQAAQAVHAITPPVLVYAIGVSREHINERELKEIATDETFYTHIDEFNDELLTAGESIADDICQKGKYHKINRYLVLKCVWV